MTVYILIAVVLAIVAVVVIFFARPMIGRSSKKTLDRKELRRIDIEYGQKKDSDRFKQ